MNNKKIMCLLFVAFSLVGAKAQTADLSCKDSVRAEVSEQLIPITRNQAAELAAQLVSRLYADKIKMARADSLLMVQKLEALKRLMVDDALRQYYTRGYEERLSRLERLLYLSLMKDEKVRPDLLKQLAAYIGKNETATTMVQSGETLTRGVGASLGQSAATPIYIDEYGRRVTPDGQLIDSNGQVVYPQGGAGVAPTIVINSGGGEGLQWDESNDPQMLTATGGERQTVAKNGGKVAHKAAAVAKGSKQKKTALPQLHAPVTTVGRDPLSIAGGALAINGAGVKQLNRKELNTAKTDSVKQTIAPSIVVKHDTVYVVRDGAKMKALPSEVKVYFAFDSMLPNAAGQKELAAVAAKMKADAQLRVELKGYSSAQGNVKYNNALSMRRAKSCAAYLIQQGVAAERIKVLAGGIDSLVSKAQARRVNVSYRID